ncbi:DNA/RNA non-specific endonuclease [Shewanella sp. KT0246]|uniref:DNA/RNA non-specific endonuclease n=1 Tax=Shewanella sp. KT0246 TaxID=2815912 RepID=UPI001BBDBA38|nr:DNA/RNA non-specific endonuclease [Shewanella sp. KT0246]GIU50266.1 hypothetical protein TUM4249_10100 [Shewanella sp. KT0246]
MKVILVLLATLLASAPAISAVYSVHCPIDCPSSPDENILIYGHVYALSQDTTTKMADWVAYEVDVVNFGPSPGRDWGNNPLIDKDSRLEESDYSGANASSLKSDKGHQAPLASFASSHYWYELNYLSNITPQHKDLNQGAWKHLEMAVRDAVSYSKPLYVITGPLYTEKMKPLPKADETHSVPSGYFKVIYDAKGNAASFIMHQTSKRSDKYCSKAASLSSIQNKIDYQLPKSLKSSNRIMDLLKC